MVRPEWHRGLIRSALSDHLVLRHVTSKRQKPVEVDLTLSPLVMEELAYVDEIPHSIEPIVICESSGMPWVASEFRRKWRIVKRPPGETPGGLQLRLRPILTFDQN
jgi:hypothetical protein